MDERSLGGYRKGQVDDIRMWDGDSLVFKSFYESFFPFSRFSLFTLFQSVWKVPIP